MTATQTHRHTERKNTKQQKDMTNTKTMASKQQIERNKNRKTKRTHKGKTGRQTERHK